jgi:hypothetical protein
VQVSSSESVANHTVPLEPARFWRSQTACWMITGGKAVAAVGDFGFDSALAKGFTSRYSGPRLMALALGRELPTREGVIGYASAFDSLG